MVCERNGRSALDRRAPQWSPIYSAWVEADHLHLAH